MLTSIANLCCYFMLDLPAEIWRETKVFVTDWWYSYYG